MRDAQEAVRIPLPVGWKPWGGHDGLINFVVPRGWMDEHFGPAHFDDPGGSGLGHESAWAYRFSCGLECVLNLYRDPPGLESKPELEFLQIGIPVPEFDHVLRHLALRDEWLDWRLDRTDLTAEERARLFGNHHSWEVWRQDDNGNAFLMQYADSERDARCVAETFERRAHKQIYWVSRRATSEG